MITQRLIGFCLKPSFLSRASTLVAFRPLFLQEKRNSSDHYKNHIRSLIGNREMVGFGINGQPIYADLSAFPFPAIRYKEDTPEIMALREKEKGDWRLISIEEKKAIYRSQFCQTFVEFQFVGSEWMAIVGWALVYLSIVCWAYILFHYYVNNPLPESFNPASKREQLRRMINMRVNPLTGISSNWDYEKNDWKKVGWFTPLNPFTDKGCVEEEED